jgi:hypothetical protein
VRARDDKVQILHDRPAQMNSDEADLRATLTTILRADPHVRRLCQLRDVISIRLDQRPKGYRNKAESAVTKRKAAA